MRLFSGYRFFPCMTYLCLIPNPYFRFGGPFITLPLANHSPSVPAPLFFLVLVPVGFLRLAGTPPFLALYRFLAAMHFLVIFNLRAMFGYMQMIPCDLKKLVLNWHEPKCTIDYEYMKVYWVYDRDKLVYYICRCNEDLSIEFKF